MTNPIKISSTQIDMFCECMRRWWFQYRLKLKVKHEDTRVLIFGTMFHRCVECYHKGIPYREILGMIAGDLLLREDEKRLATAMMNDYVTQNQSFGVEEYIPRFSLATNISSPGSWWNDRDSGYEFLFEEDLEDWSFIDMGVLLVGKIDMAFRKDNVLVVADHKTSEKKWNKTRFKMSRQLKLYHMMLSHLCPGLEIDGLWNVIVKTREKGGMYPIQRERIIGLSVRDSTEMFLEIIKDMMALDRMPLRAKTGDYYCEYMCPYSSLCQCGDSEVKIMNLVNNGWKEENCIEDAEEQVSSDDTGCMPNM